MAFSQLDLARIDKVVGEFCRGRVPAHLKSKIEVIYQVEGQAVVICEKRPHWREPGLFTETPIAKLSFTRSSGIWHLYWMRGNGKWLLYKPAFLTRVCREAVQTGVNTRRATEGPGDVVDTTSRSPTERNAVDMPVSAAAAEAW